MNKMGLLRHIVVVIPKYSINDITYILKNRLNLKYLMFD